MQSPAEGQETTWTCSDGTVIAGKRWRRTRRAAAEIGELDAGRRNASAEERCLLCIHGFMDNCESFHFLAPYLAFHGPYDDVVAVDLPSHGRSSHRPLQHPTFLLLSDVVYYIVEVVAAMRWKSFVVVGHSLGSAVSLLLAAACPDRVRKLVVIDGYGPDPRNGVSPPEQLRRHITLRQQHLLVCNSNNNNNSSSNNNKQRSQPRVYASVQDAVAARQRTAALSPGRQWISKDTAQRLVRRAIQNNGQGYTFRHGSDLLVPQSQLATFETNDALFRDIQCPVLWIRADNGWPFPRQWLDRAQRLLRPTIKVFRGSHHLHADPETRNAVARWILDNLR